MGGEVKRVRLYKRLAATFGALLALVLAGGAMFKL
jgi:hypothetical protein